MECLDVIERVHESTDWVNSMVTVIKKNGQLCICIDPRDQNRGIKREYYAMRTVKEIVARMPMQCQMLLSSRCQFRILAGQIRP